MSKEKSRTTANIINYSFQGIILARPGRPHRGGQPLLPGTPPMGRPPSGAAPSWSFFPTPYDALIRGERKVLASELYRCGGKDFLINCAPVEVEGTVSSCVIILQTVEKIMEAEHEIRKRIHRAGFVAKYSFSNILYTGGALADAVKNAMDFSAVDSNILIRGETGTGKELFAQSIHSAKQPPEQALCGHQCAALPDNILESETLRLWLEGAFTGAVKGGKVGFFRSPTRVRSSWTRSAISPPNSRASSSGSFRSGRSSAWAAIPSSPSTCASSLPPTRTSMPRSGAGRFRRILLPPGCAGAPAPRSGSANRICPADRPFSDLEREKHACALRDFTPEALALLSSYDWPGNIREIRNFCERVSILCRQETAGAADVLRALPNLTPVPSPEPPAGPEEEREALRQALLLHQGSRKETARPWASTPPLSGGG